MGKSVLKTLEHMQIPVKHVSEAAQWYVSHLGFQVLSVSEEHRHAFLTLQEGPMLMLWETMDDTDANFSVNGQTMPVLLYNTDQIHLLHDHLHELGVEITFYQNEGFGWVLKFIDPSGNMWGVIQPND